METRGKFQDVVSGTPELITSYFAQPMKRFVYALMGCSLLIGKVRIPVPGSALTNEFDIMAGNRRRSFLRSTHFDGKPKGLELGKNGVFSPTEVIRAQLALLGILISMRGANEPTRQ